MYRMINDGSRQHVADPAAASSHRSTPDMRIGLQKRGLRRCTSWFRTARARRDSRRVSQGECRAKKRGPNEKNLLAQRKIALSTLERSCAAHTACILPLLRHSGSPNAARGWAVAPASRQLLRALRTLAQARQQRSRQRVRLPVAAPSLPATTAHSKCSGGCRRGAAAGESPCS